MLDNEANATKRPSPEIAGNCDRPFPVAPVVPLARLSSVVSPGAAHARHAADSVSATAKAAAQTPHRGGETDRQPNPICNASPP